MKEAALSLDLGSSDLDAKLSVNTVRQIAALRKSVGVEAAANLLTAAREQVRRADAAREAAEQRLKEVRAKHAAFRFEVKKTVAEIAAEAIAEFVDDPLTQRRLTAIMATGDTAAFAVALAEARIERDKDTA